MTQNNTRKNISSLYTWIIPIILFAKIVRWTVMYAKLVEMSIGNGMVDRIMMHAYSFGIAGLSDMTNAGNLTERNAGALFDLINVFGITTPVGWEILFTAIFNILVIQAAQDFYRRTPSAGTRENLFIYLGIAILNIFCFNMSKEPYQMLFFFLMAWAIKKGDGYKNKCILLSVAILITVLFSRKYYGLVLIYFFILQYVVRHLFDNIDFSTSDGRKLLVKNLLYSAVIIAVCHFFLLSFLATNNEDTYQEMMDANYRDMKRASVADSEIVPIFDKGNPLFAAMDYGIKIFRLMFPIELLLKGKVTYIFLVAFQAFLALFIGNAFIRRNGDNEEEEEEVDDEEIEDEDEDDDSEEEDEEEETEQEDSSDDEEEEEDLEAIAAFEEDRRDTRTAALYLYLAFLLCSAAFEPDFGSWIRHEGITFPILLLIM